MRRQRPRPGRARLTSVRAHEQVKLLEDVFCKAPTFMHVLRGPDLVFEYANEAFHALVGRQDLIGRRAVDVLPEADGYPEQIARVMATCKRLG